MNTIDEFVRYLRAGHESELTIELRARYLARLERFTGREAELASREELTRFLTSRRWGRETQRSARSSLSVFFAWLQRTGRRADNPAEALPRVRPQEPRPRPASRAVIAAARLQASPRVDLMIRLASELGLRRAEVAQVHARDLFETPGGWWLTVHGKGDKERAVPVASELAAVMRRRAPDGFLFPGGVSGHLGAARVGELVSAVLPRGVTMHALRHSFGTTAYTKSRDLLAVQQLLGHSSPSITQRYVLVDSERLREVAQLVA